MKKVRYICKNCGLRFEAEIYETQEAEEKGIRIGPVRCLKCGSNKVEKMT